MWIPFIMTEFCKLSITKQQKMWESVQQGKIWTIMLVWIRKKPGNSYGIKYLRNTQDIWNVWLFLFVFMEHVK